MNARSGLVARIASAALTCYPPSWRRRYADEMRALLVESPAGWREVVDLAAGSIREWVRPRYSVWPTASALGRAMGVQLVLFWGTALTMAWLSQVMGAWFSASGMDVPGWLNAEAMALVAWFVLTIRINFGTPGNAITALVTAIRHFRITRPAFTIGGRELIGLALLTLVVGSFLFWRGGDQAQPLWILRLLVYVTYGSIGSSACQQTARWGRLERLYSRAVIRNRRNADPIGGLLA